MKRFGPQWPVLLGHLVVFLFAFPARRHVVPRTVIDELTAKVRCLQPEPDNPVCFGTLLSREQYLLDLDRFGYQDGRLWPHGRMSREQADIWTEAIADRDAP
jgi:hypothetical protein